MFIIANYDPKDNYYSVCCYNIFYYDNASFIIIIISFAEIVLKST